MVIFYISKSQHREFRIRQKTCDVRWEEKKKRRLSQISGHLLVVHFA